VTEVAPDRRLFELRSVRGESVWLETFRAGDGAIEMRCRFGLFGDEERERALLRAVADRLRRLRGVDYRPAS
jgi:hypothetical protein